jgi:hypothetical protein
MNTVRSSDGTTIAFTREGQGPSLIPDGFPDGLNRLVASGRRGDAVKMFMQFVGTPALADALPDATYRALPGQNHMVKPQAIAPVLTEFFRTSN